VIEIIDSNLRHVKELSKTMRLKDMQEALKMGVNPRKALHRSFNRGLYRKTVLVNNEVAAMFGVGGTIFDKVNNLYFVTGTVANTVSPLTFVRIYKEQVSIMTNMFNRLLCIVDPDYKEAIKLLEYVNFERHEPTTMINGNHFYIYMSS
jgi:hypothetical protein